MNAPIPAQTPPAPLSDALLRARYGDARPQGTLPGGETIDVLMRHRTVRAFDARPLPEGTLQTLVAAAQSAPTSSNLQAWSVVAVTDPARRATLAGLAAGQAQVRDCPLLLVFIADLSRLDRVSERGGGRADANRFLEMFLVASVDAALAAQNALVAAESLGLGTCYIGAMRNHPEQVAEVLGLPPDAFAVFGLCIGWPDPARPAEVKPRLPQPAVLHLERYDASAEPAEVERYEPAMRAFQASQRMTEVAWSAQAASRVRSPDSLTGRHTLRDSLKRLGFGLE